jgi:hypothetical protein
LAASSKSASEGSGNILSPGAIGNRSRFGAVAPGSLSVSGRDTDVISGREIAAALTEVELEPIRRKCGYMSDKSEKL